MNPVSWLVDVLTMRRPERPVSPEVTAQTVKSEQTLARAERALAARAKLRDSYEDADRALRR